ncbi:hypothetical protein [Rhizobacter sp. Root1238]|uniref:hypothetical protein n=1 Tax=Rhizobacter sp. Root1238 TaxID=1736435 RepID=UPI001F1BFFB4|nr:hypothetical protein [Rhizobacter sp. Root1238]
MYAAHGPRAGEYLDDEGGLLRPTPDTIHPGNPDPLILCGPSIDRASLAGWIRCEWALGDVVTPYVARATRKALKTDRIEFAADGSLKLKQDRHGKMPISPAKKQLEQCGKVVDGVLQAPATAVQKLLPPRKKGHTQRPLGSSVTPANRKGHQADFMTWSPDQTAKAVVLPLHEQPVGDGYPDMFNLPLSLYNAANIYKNRQTAADKVYSAKLEVVLNFRGYMDFLTKLALNEEDPTPAEADAFSRCREALCSWKDTAGIIAEYARRKSADLESDEDPRCPHANAAEANGHAYRGLNSGMAKDVVVAPASATVNFAKGVAYTAGSVSEVTSSLGAVAGAGSLGAGLIESYQALAERSAARADIARCKRAISALDALIEGDLLTGDTSDAIAQACRGFFNDQLKLARKNEKFAVGRGLNGVVRAGGGAASGLLLPMSMTGVIAGTAAAAVVPLVGAIPAAALMAYYATMGYKLHVVRRAAHLQKRDQQDGASILLNTPEIAELERAFLAGFDVTYGAGTPIGGDDAFAGERKESYAEASCVSLAVELLANSLLDAAQQAKSKGKLGSSDAVVILQALGFDPLQRIQLGIRLHEKLAARKTRGEALKLIKDTISRSTGLPTIKAEHAHIGMYRQGFEDSLEAMDISFQDADTRTLREVFGKHCRLQDFEQAAKIARAAVFDPTHEIRIDGTLIEMLVFDADVAALASQEAPPIQPRLLGDLLTAHWGNSLATSDPLYKRQESLKAFLHEFATVRFEHVEELIGAWSDKKGRVRRRELLDNVSLLLCSRDMNRGQRATLKLLRSSLRFQVIKVPREMTED